MIAAVIVKWALVALWAIGALRIVSLIGKPRKPITPTDAMWALVIQVALTVAVVLTWDTDQ